MVCQVALVVKLGGSAITKKDQQDTLDQDALSKAAELILQCHEKKLACIVVHGSGSFSRFPAEQYKVHEGSSLLADDENVKKGFCLTRKAGTKLHHHVLDSLINKGIPAVGLSFSTWKIKDCKVIEYDFGSVADLLQKGFVPLLHGDCVLDSARGCSILSGDTVVQKLSESADFEVKRVVFLTSEEGVYQKPPRTNPEALLLKEIAVNKHGKQQGKAISKKTECTDVTGGMPQKLATAVGIVHGSKGKTKVFVCKIGTRYAADVCLFGQKQEYGGTEIVYQA